MLNEALQFLLQTLVNLFLIAVLLRVYMQRVGVSFANPFAQFVVALTNFAVRPLRRIIPAVGGLDLASLLLAFLLQFLLTLTLYGLNGFPFAVAGGAVLPAFLLLALARLLTLALYVLIGLVFIQAVMSWVNPFSPLAPMFSALTRPVLAPIRRVLPPIGSVDLSPLAAFIICQLIIMLPVAFLERLALGML
jgi:YggT family protein